jgi:dTDP-L-rhamnose 4-epimerase
MNILITGGAGFIGSNLAINLNNRGHNVTILDNLQPQIHTSNPDKNSPLFLSIKNVGTFVFGDITDRNIIEKVIDNQDVIVHLAAETGTGQSMYEIGKYTNVNIQGTALLLDVLARNRHNVKKLIVASSRSIYGEGKYLCNDLGFVYPKHRDETQMQNGNFEVIHPGSKELILCATDEESKIHPSSVYGITKQVQEQLVMTVCPTIGIAPVAFRYQNIYGAGQSLNNPYTGILSIFSTRIRNQQSINIFEDGLESRDFVYIDDVVMATTLGIEKEEANNQVFNVGTGTPTTVIEVVNTLMEYFDIKVPVTISGNYRLGDIRHNYADLTKIKKILGFNPTIDFQTGCEKFIDWVIAQPNVNSSYEKSLDELKQKGLLK